MKRLIRLYATYQANKGWKAPLIVRTLDEALAHLDANRAEFRAVQLKQGRA